MAVPAVATGSGSGVPAHEALSKKPLGVGRSWRELTTPGAGTVPTREKDLSFESIFHIRIAPSHDPKRTDCQTRSSRNKKLGLMYRTQICQNIANMLLTLSIVAS
jgi:hypothetical protein